MKKLLAMIVIGLFLAGVVWAGPPVAPSPCRWTSNGIECDGNRDGTADLLINKSDGSVEINGATIEQTVTSYADLRTLSPVSDGDTVFVWGDGILGSFVYDDDLATSDDGGVYIENGAGCFVRETGGVVNVEWYGTVGDNSTDDYAAINAAITYFVASDERTFVFPECDGYKVSDTLDFSGRGDYTLHIYAPITSTKTSAHGLFDLGGATGNYVDNITVDLHGNTIDGNGDNVTGYSYSSTDGAYSTLLIEYATDIVVKNGTVDNGLISCIHAYKLKRPKFDMLKLTNSVHDNGLNLSRDPEDYSSSDQSTWNNGLVRGCYGEGNEDFGLTAFDATGVTFVNCIATGNGHDVDSDVGHGGGMSYEDDNGTPNTKNYFGNFINCRVSDNWAKGFFIDANGVSLDHQCFAETTKKSVLNADANNFTGNGIFLSTATHCNIDGRYTNNEKAGIYWIGTSASVFGEGKVNGRFDNNTREGIYLRGIENIAIDAQSDNNTLKGLHVLNATDTYNVGSGVINVQRLYAHENGQHAIFIEWPETAIVRNVTGYDNDESINIMIRNVTNAFVDGVCLLDSTGNVANTINISTGVTNSYVDNVWGEFTDRPIQGSTGKRQFFSAVYDFDVDGGAQGDIELYTLSEDATIIDAHYEVLSAFTSGGSATVAFGVATNDASGLKTAVAFDHADYNAGYHDFTPDGAAANYTTKTTAPRSVIMTIATADLTAGKVRVFGEYEISE
jgi:hypothetical protein